MEKVAIPVGMDFSELRLARLPKGGVSFDWSVIERVCQASGLPVGLFQDAPEDNLSELIVGWYQAHLQQGGERNPVADDLFYEVLLEVEQLRQALISGKAHIAYSAARNFFDVVAKENQNA